VCPRSPWPAAALGVDCKPRPFPAILNVMTVGWRSLIPQLPRLPVRHSAGLACLLLLEGLVLPTACHTPLAARRDAGHASDARSEDAAGDLPSGSSTSPDGPADAASPPDLGPTDLAVSEVPAPDLGPVMPKAFRFVNHTNGTAYVRVDGSVGCRRQNASGWQDCSFFHLWCTVTCSNVSANGDCCAYCEQELPSLYAIAPGQSRIVPWNGNIYAKTTATCSQCECQTETPVRSGTFEASASVFADYQCSPLPSLPCQATPDGVINMANPRGTHTTLAVPFSLPYPSDEIILDINSLPAMDAGIEPDLGPLDAASTGDAAIEVDVSSRPDVSSCQPLAYSHFGPLISPTYCPVDRALPECASADVGATVYRDEACALATLKAHSDCTPWSRPLGSEFVFLRDPFGGCNWSITLDSVLDCWDHVDINYSVTEPCATCDGTSPSSVMLIIPDSPRPVRATGTRVRQTCSLAGSP
jgi:hypothetical protein